MASLVGQLEAYAEKRTSRGSRDSGSSGGQKPRNSDKWGSSGGGGGRHSVGGSRRSSVTQLGGGSGSQRRGSGGGSRRSSVTQLGGGGGGGSQRGGGGGGGGGERLDDDDTYSTYTSCDGGGSRGSRSRRPSHASSVLDLDPDSPRCAAAAYPPAAAPPEFSAAGTADASGDGESRLNRMNERMSTVSDNLKQHRQHLEKTINAIDATQAGPHTSSWSVSK
jgi:hypothetical protein